MKCGRVILVGAGPGAPGLITMRGLECLRSADVVLYDNLCNPVLLREAPNAQIVFAGKHAGRRSLTQKQIHRMMARYAKAGKQVVRLKGGDPFLFGRGAEEAEYLQKQKIAFEIVPGVTSAIAVPAYAGIPVTHRDHASGVAMITAHEGIEKPGEALDYPALARFPGSLVVLMAFQALEKVSRRLIAAGRSPQTPAAVIQSGTRGFQKTVTAPLGKIVSEVRKAGLKPPAIAIIGDVVKCRDRLKWFERLPLFGRRILVTRSREQASALSSRLWELGAETLEIPTIQIQPIDSAEIRNFARTPAEWDWIAFTSAWAVDCFLKAVLKAKGDLRAFGKTRFAVIGPATAAKLEERGLRWDLMPKVHTSMGFAKEIQKAKWKWKTQRILLPKSEIGTDILEKAFRKKGAFVQPLAVYRNIQPRLTWELEALERVGVDIATFTSSSTAENFAKLVWSRHPRIRKMLRHTRFVSIGASTSATLRQLGFQVHAEARISTIEGLIQCLKQFDPKREGIASAAQIE